TVRSINTEIAISIAGERRSAPVLHALFLGDCFVVALVRTQSVGLVRRRRLISGRRLRERAARRLAGESSVLLLALGAESQALPAEDALGAERRRRVRTGLRIRIGRIALVGTGLAATGQLGGAERTSLVLPCRVSAYLACCRILLGALHVGILRPGRIVLHGCRRGVRRRQVA